MNLDHRDASRPNPDMPNPDPNPGSKPSLNPEHREPWPLGHKRSAHNYICGIPMKLFMVTSCPLDLMPPDALSSGPSGSDAPDALASGLRV